MTADGHDDAASPCQTPDIPDSITVTTVLNILHHICPPSALQSIPSHLLSKPLLHRHHFLDISTNDPAAYLTWPSDDTNTALALLESINTNDFHTLVTEHGTDSDHLCVQYAADPEAVYAHVRITPAHSLHSHTDGQPSVRLIFLWDEDSRSWRYHNSASGPFPKNSHPDISHAMALFHPPNDFLVERTYSFSVENLEDDEDTYWNSYNNLGDDLAPSSSESTNQADTEDAYWARYANVQGTADSTVPSPLPVERKVLQSHLSESDQRIFIPSSQLNIPKAEVYNPLAPPSPNSLARKLAEIPARPESPPLQDDSSPTTGCFSSPPTDSLDSDQETFIVLPRTEPAVGDKVDNVHSSGLESYGAADDDLKLTIRALYRLWNATSKRSREEFAALVDQALSEETNGS